MRKESFTAPDDEAGISQDIVDQLMKARTMEEYLAIAADNGIDWNSLSDDWLEAIVSGDVSDLVWQQQRRQRRMRRTNRNENRI